MVRPCHDEGPRRIRLGRRPAGGLYADADITGRVPMGRFAVPEDVARAIVFLADPAQSGFVNGHTLVVDGGWTADGSWESLRLSHRGAHGAS